MPGRPWLISGDAAGDGASRNRAHRKGPPGPTSPPTGSQRGAGEKDAAGAGRGTGGGSATGCHGDRVGGHGHSSLSLLPAGAAARPPHDASLGVAISGCPSWGGYFGVQAVPTSGNVARTAGHRTRPSPPISPPQPDGADSTEPARAGHYPYSVPFGAGTPQNPARGEAAPALCRAMAPAREWGQGEGSPQPSEQGVSSSLSPQPAGLW